VHPVGARGEGGQSADLWGGWSDEGLLNRRAEEGCAEDRECRCQEHVEATLQNGFGRGRKLASTTMGVPEHGLLRQAYRRARGRKQQRLPLRLGSFLQQPICIAYTDRQICTMNCEPCNTSSLCEQVFVEESTNRRDILLPTLITLLLLTLSAQSVAKDRENSPYTYYPNHVPSPHNTAPPHPRPSSPTFPPYPVIARWGQPYPRFHA